jgi:PAS domain S-box-containing protein
MWLAPFEEVNRTIMVDADRWYREMFEASTVGMALADEHGLLLLANEAYAAIVGCPRDLLWGRSSRDFTHPDDLDQHAAMEQMMDDAEARGESVHVEKRYLHPDGTVRSPARTADDGPWRWSTTSPTGGGWRTTYGRLH